jgi:hypothetical protein
MVSRLQIEKRTVGKMIVLYCQKKHYSENLCPDCMEIQLYALQRLDRCVYGNNKPACKKCSVHCYNPVMQKKIRNIMRFSGPLMLWYHPIYAIVHLFQKLTAKNTGQ